MAGTSLLALLDDISSLLDDVATLTKVATRKTAGVLGDDLALNAQQVTGVRADRELPVVWAVAKGSLLNKVILVPSALLISAFLPQAIVPLLMIGGSYLCFEGFEKVHHASSRHDPTERHAELQRVVEAETSELDLVALERDKVKGAVRTDFVLSAEIVTLSLASVAQAPFATQVLVLSTIGLLMTVGVYGLVAAIVKLDDLGVYLCRRGAGQPGSPFVSVQHALGSGILHVAPWIMKVLSVAGTIAMFIVGGEILVHGLPWVEAALHHAMGGFVDTPTGTMLAPVARAAAAALFGGICGGLIWLLVSGVRRLRARIRS